MRPMPRGFNAMETFLPIEGLDMAVPPFLRWAGNKRWLARDLATYAPSKFSRYVEPFLGSGAVLLAVSPAVTRLGSDVNAELVNCFLAVRDAPEQLLNLFGSFQFAEADYLAARERFNFLKQEPDIFNLEKAALFLYLNRTSFNSIYRENSAGQFNVPWNKKTHPPSGLESQVRKASVRLRGGTEPNAVKASLVRANYRELLDDAGSGDWVFLDPPYVPSSSTSHFVGYSQNGFSIQEQVNLRDAALQASNRGALILLSNSFTETVIELFSGKPWRIEEVDVRRSVGAQSATRKRVTELLVRNYD